MKQLLTSTAIVLTLAAGGCAKEWAPHYVPDSNGNAAVTTLPDGSQVSLIMGGAGADPNNTQQRIDGGYVHTYWVNGKLRSDFDSRPTVSPSLGLEIANMVVPSVIQGAATVGAGVLVDSGLQHAARITAYGNYQGALANAKALVQGDQAIGQGYASAKPANINVQGSTAIATANPVAQGGTAIASANPHVDVNATSTSAANSSSAANATASAVQSQTQLQQQQQQQTMPLNITGTYIGITKPPVE